MKPLLDRSVLFGVGLVVALLVVNAGLGIRNARELQQQAQRVAHTHEVLDQSSDLMITLLNAETSQRGYLVTGKDEFLELFTTAVARLDERLQSLEVKTRDNPHQTERIKKIRDLSDLRLGSMNESLQLRRAKAAEERLIEVLRHGKQQMDAIRDVMSELRQEEQQLLQERETSSSAAFQFAIFTALLGVTFGLVMVLGFVHLLRRSLRLRNVAAASIHEHRERLQTTLASIGDAVIATDVQGHVTYLNPVAETLTGWSVAAASGQSLT
ncbi:MAG: luxQ 3, partial [Planctomycetaceae bacterium]|nr:luxQ 3 [Planctomycetaceae bacterium]